MILEKKLEKNLIILRKKYGKRSVRILEGDAVKVIRGEFSGVDGKVTKVSLIKNGISPSKANKLSIIRGTHTQCIALFVGFW